MSQFDKIKALNFCMYLLVIKVLGDIKPNKPLYFRRLIDFSKKKMKQINLIACDFKRIIVIKNFLFRI